jgi:hypothetical protein
MRYRPRHRWLRIDEGDLMDGMRDTPPRAMPGALAWLVMTVIALAIAGYAIYRPAGNADLIEYIAVVHQWEGATGADLNTDTYTDLDQLLDDQQFADVTGRQGITALGRDAYLQTIKADPEALRQQLPFYSVKPLYPALMAALGVVGVPLGFGSVLISAAAYAALVLLLFRWASRHVGEWSAVILVSLIALAAPFWILARLSTPDALALLIVMSGLYVLLEWRRPGLALAILVVAILARPNAVVAVLAIAAVAVLARPASGIRIAWPRAAIAAVGGIALYLGLTVWSGNYGYATLFYHAVVGYLPFPADGAPPLSILEVLRIYAFRLLSLSTSPVPLFVLLGAIAMRARVSDLGGIRSDGPSLAILAMYVTMGLTWLSYPNEPERILVAPFLLITIVLVCSVVPRLARSLPAGSATA